MILLDTGPLVALFDPRDGDHTVDRNDFSSYRIRWGRSHRTFRLVH